ncbi:flagellum-specific ATP synthase FliI [Escherichia coli]|nr:flagellum-specific ATP synthase FliI [Escherichia coli]
MTTRLTRWLTTLDNFEAKMAQLPAVRRYGRLTRATGLVLEATGLQLPLGATCVIERQNGTETHEVESEVVGFNGQRLFLMPLEEVEGVLPGARVYAKNISAEGLQSGKQLPLGPALLGRVLDGSGKPLDGLPSPDTTETGALITPPFNPLQRTPIEHVLDTGVRPINALLTVGRGQRMGLFAGSGVGKSVLLGMMARYTRADVIVVGLIGERGREVKDFIENILGAEGRARSVVIAAPADVSPLLRMQGAAYATRIAEDFRDRGQHVLLIMDSLTRYAMAQREIALAIGEPPATKGYPPSVFAKLPALVERAGNGISGGGSITAFYTVLTEGDDQQDPIADSARAILDGHIVLSRRLAEAGHYPANRITKDAHYLYRYDEYGRLTEKTDRIPRGVIRTDDERTHHYHYDSQHRLVFYTRIQHEEPLVESRYLYDPLGRRTGKRVWRRERDLTGWMSLSRKPEVTWYGWDGDRLTTVQTDTTRIQTVYQPGSFTPLIRVETENGEREKAQRRSLAEKLQQEGSEDGHGVVFPAELVRLLDRLEEEIRADRVSDESRAWLAQCGLTVERLAAQIEPVYLPERKIHLYHCDHRGLPLALISTEGATEWRGEYDEWGNQMNEENPHHLFQPYRLPGQQYDDESGLCYNRHRYYDPLQGRYITQDPIGLSGGLNTYSYPLNPINEIDPLGLKVIVVASDPNEAKLLQEAYAQLNTTKRGQEITKPLEDSKDVYNIYTIHRDAFYCPAGTTDVSCQGKEKAVFIEPNECVKLPTAQGLEVTSLAVELGHELGHAHGVHDDGGDRMNNVNLNENPIRAGLGENPRTAYVVPRVEWEKCRK